MKLFASATYKKRREQLFSQIDEGIILLLGNPVSPINFPANHYPFRQDSSFLYYFGHNVPDMAGYIDVETGEEILFGKELSLAEEVWTGPLPSLKEQAEQVGVSQAYPFFSLPDFLQKARQQGRTIHWVPQYRAANILRLSQWLHISPEEVSKHASESLIKAIVRQRSIKSKEEVAEIEEALRISRHMHLLLMQQPLTGRTERDVAGQLEGIALSKAQGLSFPIILTTQGQILHNAPTDRPIKEGQLLLHDSGVNSPGWYASDITRTIPTAGYFSTQQKEIYQIVLQAQQEALSAIQPGIAYREIHLLAARIIAEGLIALGLMQGDAEEAVRAGAHALFFPTGLGHMLGLDVHDMEALGEEYVGYNQQFKRNHQFGLNHLRLARTLEPGFVVTVEPGIYFIPALIHFWKQEKKHTAFIRYDRLEAYLDFGGIRIEDDVLVTREGYRVLGEPIPKTVDEIESLCSSWATSTQR